MSATGIAALNSSRVKRARAGAVVAAFLVMVGTFSFLNPNVQGDTVALVGSAKALKTCFETGTPGPPSCPHVEHFPLFQHMPALLLSAVGIAREDIERALARLNLIAFVASAGVLAYLGRRVMASGAPLLVLLMMTSPLLWYASASFAEAAAAFATIAFTAAVLLRSHWAWVTGTLWFAGVTKETALPFLLAIGCVALAGTGRGSLSAARATIVAIGVGASLVVATNASFNYVRYESLTNRVLLQPLFRVPSFETRLNFFAGLWISPTGLLFFAPLFTALFVYVALRAVRSMRRRDVAEAWPGLVIAGIVIALTVGFAGWYTPFGGASWGPRFLLPWLPALAIVSAASYAVPIERVARRLFVSPLRATALAVIVLVVTLPQVSVLGNPTGTLVTFFAPDAECPAPPVIQADEESYYRCMNHYIWSKRPMLLTALSGLATWWGAALTVGYALAVVATIAWARSQLLRSQPGPSPASRERCSI